METTVAVVVFVVALVLRYTRDGFVEPYCVMHCVLVEDEKEAEASELQMVKRHASPRRDTMIVISVRSESSFW